MIIIVVICFFSFLILVSLHDFINPSFKEGATGTCELDKDPTYLAKVNAANIKAMKDEIGESKKLKEDIKILSEIVEKNAKSIKAMGDEIKGSADELTGGLDLEGGDELPSINGL